MRTRTLDIHTIGAGGGSLAWIDPGGLLKVGPASAGAVPGPAAYGRGGERPTVTDANVVLGRLSQTALLDGRMPVYPDKAREAIEAQVCAPLGLDLARAAAGILEIINVNMTGAVRVISVEEGEDPRAFALMPFGGAGPLHAADVARIMGIGRILVPERPGVLSALGLLHADTRGDFGLTRLAPAEASSVDALSDGIERLSARAADWLATERFSADDASWAFSADMRYHGQNFELSAPIPNRRIDAAALAALSEAFHAAHEAAYGYRLAGRMVEIVNLRLAVTVARPLPPLSRADPGTRRTAEAVAGSRKAWFPATGFVETPVYRRDALPPEGAFSGPAIVEQMDATIVVPPDGDAHVDPIGNLVIRLGKAAAGEKAA